MGWLRRGVRDMTAKEYLSGARDILIRLDAMSEQLTFLKSAAEYSGVQYSHLPRPSTRNVHKNEDAYIRVIEKEEQITAAQKKLSEIETVVSKVGDSTQQAILSKRYLSKKSWGEISRELYYSIPRLYEIHRDALAAVDVLLSGHSKT